MLSGNLPIFTFSLVLGLGVGVGLCWSVLPLRSLPNVAQRRLNDASIALLGALIGGRAGYILLNWVYYQRHLWDVFQVWLGGFTWIGALAGAFTFLIITNHLQKTSLGYILDGLLPLFSSITISVWLASWLTGYAYGIEISHWWGIPALDESGVIAQRWPTQLIAALSTLGFHWLAEFGLTRRWSSLPGLASSLVLAGFSITILCLTPFRGDPIPLLKGIRLDIWASGVFFTLSTLMAITFYILPKFTEH